MRRDDLIRHLWLSGFEFTDDFPSATKFVRQSDKAAVLVPHREDVPDALAAPRTPHMSPCCGAESTVRRIVGHLAMMRCSKCEHLWERELGSPRPAKLRAV